MEKRIYECDHCHKSISESVCVFIEINVTDKSMSKHSFDTERGNFHLCQNCKSEFGISKGIKEVEGTFKKFEVEAVAIDKKNIFKLIKDFLWRKECNQE